MKPVVLDTFVIIIRYHHHDSMFLRIDFGRVTNCFYDFLLDHLSGLLANMSLHLCSVALLVVM